MICTMMTLASFQAFAKEKKAPVAALNTCISGLIVDEKTGESLAGVEVELQGTDLKTYTDFDGKFSFAGVNPGTYKVATSMVSYKQHESNSIQVDNNQMHNLNLAIQTADK